MTTITVEQGQTPMDVAIQEYGCYEGIMTLLEDNYPLSLTDDLTPGQVLNIRDEVPQLNETNQAIAAQFKAKNIRVNSGFTNEEESDNGYVNPGYVDPGYVD